MCHVNESFYGKLYFKTNVKIGLQIKVDFDQKVEYKSILFIYVFSIYLKLADLQIMYNINIKKNKNSYRLIYVNYLISKKQ